MPTPREEPIFVSAQTPPSDASHSAAIVFLHGLGDGAHTFESIALQFQSAKKLPYMQWVLPNALDNMDAMDRAWYTPTGLPKFPSSRPELDDPEDEDGMLVSRKYIVSLIDDLVEKQGVPPNRIVLAGFSQGCAMTLLTGSTSKYAGKLAGLAGICGYFPLPERIEQLKEEDGGGGSFADVPVLISRGTRDMLIPKRYHNMCIEKLASLGVHGDSLEVHEYENMGHAINATLLRDLCVWLERVVPPVD